MAEEQTDEQVLESMPIEEFKRKYMRGEKQFDFSKFEIICKKCGSKDIEFGGVVQEDWSSVYYDGESPDLNTFFVCKCHSCGNGFALRKEGSDDILTR